ncbi:MAG: hypothetical protein PHX60_07445 [Giesbergeria sp.]|uniref:hypothetical protein n=1 Tax=Giesbergeria sp. TaxID=2818473 RepID=UPI00261BF9B6|nr:hypothetical protein [Giesbergeria sp.]MDD2609522.1 hypothetical protein [Giesbergeria sp.]
MAHIYRLIFTVFLFLPFSVHAAISPTFSCQSSYPSNFPALGSMVVGCGGCSSDGKGALTIRPSSTSFCEAGASCGSCGIQHQYSWNAPASCPANSSLSGSECACNSGFKEQNGSCVSDKPKDPKCGDLTDTPLGLSDYGASFGTKSADWMKNQIGKPTNSCFPGGCVVSGEATGCAGGGTGSTYCKIANPKFTGDSCNESDNSGDDDNCQPGYKASEYVPGVCVPDGSDGDGDGTGDGGTDDDDSDGLCPDKTDPTKRVPCQGKPSKCSGGLCESKYVPGLCIPCDTSVNGDGTTTTCNPTTGKCTTTNPDGTTDEQDKTDFCRENPKSPMCIENKWGGGSCASGSFSCDGDAIQCAIAKEQHRRNCKLFDDKSAESALYEQEKGKEGNQTDDLPGNETINMIGRIDSTDALGGGGAGVQDLTVTVAGSSITLPFSKINSGLDALGRVLLAVSFLIALRIVGRG